jgi:transposase-like protein
MEVITDKAAAYPIVLDELLPAVWHRTDQYANNHIEADHGRLKARLRPTRPQGRSWVDPQVNPMGSMESAHCLGGQSCRSEARREGLEPPTARSVVCR